MMSDEVHGLFQLLLADTWLKKSEVVQKWLAYLPFMRATLEQEISLAMQRGAEDDARIFAAHVSLLRDIQRYGLTIVQAEIMRTTRCRDYAGL